jgi:hypothetical protein
MESVLRASDEVQMHARLIIKWRHFEASYYLLQAPLAQICVFSCLLSQSRVVDCDFIER